MKSKLAIIGGGLREKIAVEILKKNIMKYFNKDIIIIDLASVPGGFDFEAAEKIRLKATLLSGISGKYAPVSAGEILGNYYLNEIKKREGGMLI